MRVIRTMAVDADTPRLPTDPGYAHPTGPQGGRGRRRGHLYALPVEPAFELTPRAFCQMLRDETIQSPNRLDSIERHVASLTAFLSNQNFDSVRFEDVLDEMANSLATPNTARAAKRLLARWRTDRARAVCA